MEPEAHKVKLFGYWRKVVRITRDEFKALWYIIQCHSEHSEVTFLRGVQNLSLPYLLAGRKAEIFIHYSISLWSSFTWRRCWMFLPSGLHFHVDWIIQKVCERKKLCWPALWGQLLSVKWGCVCKESFTLDGTTLKSNLLYVKMDIVWRK